MRIANIRYGHATNSSSLHSIIISGTSRYFDEGYDSNEFGQQHFILSSYDEKMRYFSQILGETISGRIRKQTKCGYELPDDVAKRVKKKVDKCLGGDYYSVGGYVDHQSNWPAPLRPDGNIDFKFFAEFAREFAADKTVSIEGGSDGDDYGARGREHKKWNHTLANVLNTRSHSLARKDGDWWTLFDATTGNKIKCSFKPRPRQYAPTRPELVDVKITSKCNYGCEFCYQNSHKDGEYAEYTKVRQIIDWAAKNQIFEIALGGGDPVLHPQFINILEYGKKKGVSVSFSTKSMDWLDLKNETQVIKFVNSCRAYGISVGTAKEVNEAFAKHEVIMDAAEKHGYSRIRNSPALVIQFIPEYYGLEKLKSIYRAISNNRSVPTFYFNPPTLLLLGFKNRGRGKDMKYRKCLGWSILLKSIMRQKFDEDEINIAVDTLFATRYPDDMKHISKELYYTKEGVYSLYIDALKSKVAKSSFAPRSYDFEYIEDVLPIFKKWNGVKDATKIGVDK